MSQWRSSTGDLHEALRQETYLVDPHNLSNLGVLSQQLRHQRPLLSEHNTPFHSSRDNQGEQTHQEKSWC